MRPLKAQKNIEIRHINNGYLITGDPESIATLYYDDFLALCEQLGKELGVFQPDDHFYNLMWIPHKEKEDDQ